MRSIIEPAGPAAAEITALVAFHNAAAQARDSVCVFDCRALPKQLSLSFRLTAGTTVHNPQNATVRIPGKGEPAAPVGFDATAYDVTPATLGRVSVPLGPFQTIRALLSVRRTAPVPAGQRYRFEVQQYESRLDPTHFPPQELLSLIGGSTFVIPVASGPPTPVVRPPFMPEHHDNEREIPWTPPWLRDAVIQRRRELFTGGAGPYATAVFLRNDRPKYTGKCPIAVTFSAKITVAGPPGVLSYVWLRSDGAKGSVQQVTVHPGDRVIEVHTSWTLGSPGQTFEGWLALRVLAPPLITSESSQFTIACSK